jgi:CubicO group peptidase (beta-lactamase class C family)
MGHKHVPLFALLLLFAATVVTRADQTDDYVKAEMQRQRIPGLSLVVIRDGKIIKAAGYGLANMKLKTPATPPPSTRSGQSASSSSPPIMLLVRNIARPR